MIEIKIFYDFDLELVLNNIWFWVLLLLIVEQKYSIDDLIEMEKVVDVLLIEQIVKCWIVVLDFDEVVEKVG